MKVIMSDYFSGTESVQRKNGWESRGVLVVIGRGTSLMTPPRSCPPGSRTYARVVIIFDVGSLEVQFVAPTSDWYDLYHKCPLYLRQQTRGHGSPKIYGRAWSETFRDDAAREGVEDGAGVIRPRLPTSLKRWQQPVYATQPRGATVQCC